MHQLKAAVGTCHAGSRETPLRTIVVIDDNVDLSLTVKVFLTRHGHSVYVAETARDGLALVARFRPDIVFSDVDLPDRDGFELAAMIKSEPGLRSIPVVAVTARGEFETTGTNPFDQILLKPVPLATMLQLVEDLSPDRRN
jgi:CheY-like chemotaxis protein